MFQAKDYLFIISAKRREYFYELCSSENLSLMEIEILLFLHRNPDSNTLTDIIHAKDYTKSHVSSSIAKLVSHGYLLKNSSETNKKVLKLELLPKSKPIMDKILLCVENFHKDALQDINQNEIDEINRLLIKICNNLKEKN